MCKAVNPYSSVSLISTWNFKSEKKTGVNIPFQLTLLIKPFALSKSPASQASLKSKADMLLRQVGGKQWGLGEGGEGGSGSGGFSGLPTQHSCICPEVAK